jgi:hypothetical protein
MCIITIVLMGCLDINAADVCCWCGRGKHANSSTAARLMHQYNRNLDVRDAIYIH